MKTNHTMRWLFLLCSSPFVCAPVAAQAASTAAHGEAQAVADDPTAPFRRDLLYVAFQAASAMPPQSHEKSRCKAQEKVAIACLELGQATLAIEFGRQITDWRRGVVFADHAFWLATRGAPDEARRQLEFAERIADDRQREGDQEWRRDTIRFHMARAYAALKDEQKARSIAAAIDPSSGQAFDAGWAATAASRADLVTADMLDRELSELDGTIASAGAGQAYNAVAVCVRLYDKFYADAEKREKIGRRVRTRDSKLPPDMYVTGLVELARVATTHRDNETAKQLLGDAREHLRNSELGLEYSLGMTPVIATVHAQAGESDAARAELTAGLEQYQAKRDTFRQTKRPEILRPFAEAYHHVGDRDQAIELYEQVIEEGMENPNSRPRAHAISETCVSMARIGFEPTAKLRLRIREIVNGLGDPW